MIFLIENGFSKLGELLINPAYGFAKTGITEEMLRGRVNFICEFFKNQIDKTNLKKKKTDKIMLT